MADKAIAYTRDERLAIGTAFLNVLKGNVEDIKQEVRMELMEMAEESGIDRRAIKVNGTKVGEIGVTWAKPHPVILDQEEAMATLEELGLIEKVPAKGWEKHFALVGGRVVDKATGEVATGIGWEEERPKTAVVRGCHVDDVMDALGGYLPEQAFNGLLGE